MNEYNSSKNSLTRLFIIVSICFQKAESNNYYLARKQIISTINNNKIFKKSKIEEVVMVGFFLSLKNNEQNIECLYKLA
jgi:hypothetical protein